ncbi:hypothetical protein NFHSH190041_34660 [Shewanella sp. NFH-SH190041]|uniref:hypothetical protein n=1 Tax=Shewanella sp. NFH-SH190041 TaxID=2950245 RepID=UPI0021C29B91|nr:hypothetical protein [Shewanella sp. NFH-SH190041]BDM66014.1 hypothetical protein NFHSH190041_34660 [Shewanella sp. NFH-SH190041]
MNDLSLMLRNAETWLALIGGSHCLLLLWLLRKVRYHNHTQAKLLSALLGLVTLFFFSQLLEGIAPEQHNQALLAVLQGSAYLFAPLLYLYCRQLQGQGWQRLQIWHFLPSGLIFCGSQLRLGPSEQAHVLMLGFILQSSGYLLVLAWSLRRHHPTTNASLKISRRWQWALLLTATGNLLLYTFLTVLPALLAIMVPPILQLTPELGLLLSIYGLAVYGLIQTNELAYQHGWQTAAMKRQSQSVEQVLEQEELDFLQQVLSEPPAVTPMATELVTDVPKAPAAMGQDDSNQIPR